MTLLGWFPLLAVCTVLTATFPLGILRVKRDWFFLLVFGQSIGYLDVAPTLASSGIPLEAAGAYTYFQWMAALLFQVPLLVIYARRMRQAAEPRPTTPQGLSLLRALLLFGGVGVLAVGYYVVAVRHGLLYRRLSDDLTGMQLELNIVEFVVYRSFIELGSFFIALQLLVLRGVPPEERPRWMTGAFAVSALAFAGYAIVNSRMMSITFVGTLYGVYLLTSPTELRFRAGILLGGLVTGVLALYSMRVATNVRQSVASGEGIFAAQNFSPIALDRGKEEDPLSWRLNGLDLIVQISDNVESFGPAWGKAWALPFVISLDPIVRSDLTEQAKRAKLTTPKSFLLLMYAGVAKTDYYNCILTDAYGNLGKAGFVVVAVVLAWLLSLGTRLLASGATPLAIVFGLFVITRSLPFEQEFGALLYGWIKMLPFLLAGVIVFPLRRTRVAA